MTYEEGLRHELEGYERTGNKDRARQVEAELDRISKPPAPPPTISVTDPEPVREPVKVPAKPRAKK